jgi:DNA-binding response OmpR family regulator
MSNGPVVLLVLENGESSDAIAHQLTLDGNDVIRIPVAHEDLLARVQALLRGDVPGLADPTDVIGCGALQIDTASRTVTIGPTPVDLRRLEYELLVHLARDPHRVYTKQELLRDVWGFRSQGTTRTVDSHASRLRRKLALAGAEGYVTNVWGVGFRLAPGARLRVLPGGLAA